MQHIEALNNQLKLMVINDHMVVHTNQIHFGRHALLRDNLECVCFWGALCQGYHTKCY